MEMGKITICYDEKNQKESIQKIADNLTAALRKEVRFGAPLEREAKKRKTNKMETGETLEKAVDEIIAVLAKNNFNYSAALYVLERSEEEIRKSSVVVIEYD